MKTPFATQTLCSFTISSFFYHALITFYFSLYKSEGFGALLVARGLDQRSLAAKKHKLRMCGDVNVKETEEN